MQEKINISRSLFILAIKDKVGPVFNIFLRGVCTAQHDVTDKNGLHRNSKYLPPAVRHGEGYVFTLSVTGGGGYLSHNALQHEPPPPGRTRTWKDRTPPRKDQKLEGLEPPPPKGLQNSGIPPPPKEGPELGRTGPPQRTSELGDPPHYTHHYTSALYGNPPPPPPLYHTIIHITILQHYRDHPQVRVQVPVWVQVHGEPGCYARAVRLVRSRRRTVLSLGPLKKWR